VRFAHPDEARALRRLAQLDDAPELVGEILVATIDGDVVAALSLDDGRVIANPFVFTSSAVELLRHSATALRGHPRRRSWRSALHLRLASTGGTSAGARRVLQLIAKQLRFTPMHGNEHVNGWWRRI
jgi:hypothetical protein